MTRQRRGQLQTRAREFSPSMRMLVVLFCALYVVAPLWHVCEMSGQHCQREAAENSLSSTRLVSIAHLQTHPQTHHDEAHSHDSGHADAEVEVCQDKEKCLCPADGSSHKHQADGKAQVSSRDSGFSGTCLAMLLTTMPGRTVAFFGFVPFFSQRILPAIFSFVVRPVASLPQPPARGPPRWV